MISSFELTQSLNLKNFAPYPNKFLSKLFGSEKKLYLVDTVVV